MLEDLGLGMSDAAYPMPWLSSLEIAKSITRALLDYISQTHLYKKIEASIGPLSALFDER